MARRKIDRTTAEWISITTLKPWADNPRVNDGAVDTIATSIKRFGFGSPILVRKANNEVIAGHTRLKAATKLGMREVLVRFLDLSEGEAHALALADNKLNELADWSDDLDDVLRALASDDVELDGLGFSDALLADLFDAPKETLAPKFPEPKRVADIGPYAVPGMHIGDTVECMKKLPDNCIDCVVTSPPYWGLRSYLPDESGDKSLELGLERTPEEYVDNMVRVFSEVQRVLKPYGTCWLNLGDSYAGGVMAPPGTKLQSGNRGATRAEGVDKSGSGMSDKQLLGVPWRVALALQSSGWFLRSDIVWSKPNPMPESVTDRPTKSHEYIFLLTKTPRYHYDHQAIRESSDSEGGHNKPTVWTIDVNRFASAHFATMPSGIVEPCIKAGCPHDGVVFDPFMGSGTVGKVAQALGRLWLGFDLDERNAALVNERIATGK